MGRNGWCCHSERLWETGGMGQEEPHEVQEKESCVVIGNKLPQAPGQAGADIWKVPLQRKKGGPGGSQVEHEQAVDPCSRDRHFLGCNRLNVTNRKWSIPSAQHWWDTNAVLYLELDSPWTYCNESNKMTWKYVRRVLHIRRGWESYVWSAWRRKGAGGSGQCV